MRARHRTGTRLLAGLILAFGVTAGAYGAGASTRVPPLSRAMLVRPAAWADEAPIGTRVGLSQVTDVEFASERVGYALGGPLGSTYPLMTTDGGHSWFIDGPAFFLPVADGAAAVDALSVGKSNEAYAYGGGSSVDVTTDAGKRWWRAYLGQAVPALSGRGHDLWALAAGASISASGSAAPPMLLYDSENGGRSWKYRSTLPDLRGWEADLSRPSATTAFALVKSFGPDNPADAGIVETTDAGATWTRRSDPCDQELSKRGFSFAERLVVSSPTSLWLFCGSQPSTGVQAKLVERSSDAGRSWTLVASNTPGEHARPDDISAIGSLPDSGMTGYLSATSPSDAWLILTGNSALWKTTDGGHTWTKGAPAKIEAQFPQEFSVAGKSMFVKTHNGLWEHSASGWKLVAGTSNPY